MKTFKQYEEAVKWAMTHGKENCLPCHEWHVVSTESGEKAVAIRYRASRDHVGYAE